MKGEIMAEFRKKNLESLKKLMNPHVNVLRRSLITANSSKGLYYRGRGLAGGRHLINTYKAVKSDRINDDRFRTINVDPKLSAGFSISIDCSGSMDCSANSWGGLGRMSRFENVATMLSTFLPICDRLGIASYAGMCDATRAKNGSALKGNLLEITTPNQKWNSGNDKRLFDLWMCGGTHIATYALTAIEMAEELPSDQKIAMFITDGYCSSVKYLESLKRQAEKKGIVLVGVGIGDAGERTAKAFPNGIFAKNAKDLSKHLLKHLSTIIKRGGAEMGVEV